MSTKDEPAFPAIKIIQDGDPAYVPPTRVHHSGFTKYEDAALKLMCALIGNANNRANDYDFATIAFNTADAFFAELEKRKERK